MTFQPTGEFLGKRVLVTGGRGIGRAIAEAFLKEGAQVFIFTKSQTTIDILKKELPTVTTFCIDIANWEQTQAAVANIIPLDHVVNNAGILIDQPFLDITPEAFDTIFGVNVRGLIAVSQAFAKGNKAIGHSGTIVNIGSATSDIHLEGTAMYSTTKTAVNRITSQMAIEFGKFGIRVNCIIPGLILTDIIKDAREQTLKDLAEIIEKRKQTADALTLEDISEAVLFLSSKKSKQIVGKCLLVDGGITFP